MPKKAPTLFWPISEKALLALVVQGFTDEDIAKRVGEIPRAVRHLRSQYGIRRDLINEQKLDPDTLADIQSEIHAGRPDTELVMSYLVTQAQIDAIKKRMYRPRHVLTGLEVEGPLEIALKMLNGRAYYTNGVYFLDGRKTLPSTLVALVNTHLVAAGELPLYYPGINPNPKALRGGPSIILR